jgi:flagellar biosynthetic protein FlhB
MSDENREDRTEQASSRRLQRAHQDGDVAVARDAATLAGLAAGGWTLMVAAPGLLDALVNLVRVSAQTVATGQPRDLVPGLTKPGFIVVQVCAATAIAAALALILQTRGGFWPELTLPNFAKLFGGGRLKKLFKKDTAIDLGMTVVKIATVAAALWSVFRDEFLTLPRLVNAEPGEMMAALFGPIGRGLVKIMAAFALIAGADLALTRFRFRKRMMMTKEEAKREYREDEGDPLIRSRRRRKHRELVKGHIQVEVPRADVVLVNPTHVAVALRYRAQEDRAPRVIAKGKGQLAEIMRDLARANGIPIVEDIPLARLLYKRVKVGRSVPAETFKAVAAILAFVYRVLGRNPSAVAR